MPTTTAETDIVAFLSEPGTLSTGKDPVEVQQTTSSWIFLTADVVYKLRKPIHTNTLDFTTPDLREQGCRRELISNQRFSPGVYLSVLPIRQTDHGELSIVKPGRTIDWLLKMRRLDSEVSLERLMEQQLLSGETLDRLAKFLTDLLVTQPPLAMKAGDIVSRLSQRVQGKDGLFPGLDSNIVHWIQCSILRYIAVANSDFAQRVCDGRMIDGHGDLDPAHIFLGSKPALIGSPARKEARWCDIASELARLAMECDHRQYPEVGIHLKEYYEETSKDVIPASLFSFYKSLHALDQAETHAGESISLSRAYLKMARVDASEFSPLVLVVVDGKIRSRRSEMVDVIVDRLHAKAIQTELPGMDVFDSNPTIVCELPLSKGDSRGAIEAFASTQKLHIHSIDANRVLSGQLDAVCENIRQLSCAHPSNQSKAGDGT